jgi:outer membrane protein assembly factor BamB
LAYDFTVRKRFPLLLLALTVVLLLLIWTTGDRITQQRFMMSVPVVAIALLLAGAWWLTNRLVPWRTRMLGALGAVALLAACVGLLRIRGVTGDLIPILEWRWASREAAGVQLPQAAGRAQPEPEAAPTAPPPAPAGAGAGEPADSLASVPKVPAPESTAREEVPPAEPATREFPQFLGPNRNNVIDGIRLARDWTAQPPRLVWRIPVGAGWSGFGVSGGLAITQEQRGDQEMVVAYDLATGKPRWAHGDTLRFASVMAGDGPRATPTIAGARVVTLGSTGLLNVLDRSTGQLRWQRRVAADHAAPEPEWGRSGSPLVLDDRVIVSVGGPNGHSLVAYALATGDVVWSAGDDAAGYSSPALMTLAGRPQIVIFNRASVAGHDPETGRLLWSQPWPSEQPNVAQPVPFGAAGLIVSSGYGVGAKLVELAADGDRFTPRIVWESPRLKAKFANFVVVDGYVYGLDDGVLACVNASTGERVWKAGRYGHGQLLLVDRLLLVQTEDGEIVLVEPSPAAHRELTRFTVFDGKTWNSPALAGPRLLVRTDQQAACYELPVSNDD